MFHFTLFPERNKEIFFQKNPTIFGPLCPFLGKTECSSKFFSYHFFLILTKYHCAKFWRKSNAWIPSNTGFRRTHAHMVQAYHETPHISNHSDSEINFLSVNITIFYLEVALYMQISTFTIIQLTFYLGQSYW